MIAAFAVALLLASGAEGSDAKPEKLPETFKATDQNGEKLICKSNKGTGSRLAKRRNAVCMTKAEWDQLEIERQQDFNRGTSVQGPKG